MSQIQEIRRQLEQEYEKEGIYISKKDRERMSEFKILIPFECPECRFKLFYVWGTIISGRLYLEAVCKKCGTTIRQAKNFS
ncbi:MAG: hypothetical protein ACUVV4_04300 [Candidatus Bathyarchaeia archaeon]